MRRGDLEDVIGAEALDEIEGREALVEGGMPGRSPLKMTRRERREWMYGVQARRRIEEDLHEFVDAEGVPAEWHAIWEDRDRRDARRTRCTVAFDADVVRFFRAMGPGYQPRMNRVLRAFMHLRLAGLVAGPDANRYVDHPGLVLAETLRREEAWGEDPEADEEEPAAEEDAADPAETDADAWAAARRAVEAGEWKG